MKKPDKRADTPSLDTNDELKVKEIAHPFRFQKYSKETELTELIVEAVETRWRPPYSNCRVARIYNSASSFHDY